MVYDGHDDIIIDAELDVKISVLPYTGCYIDRIRSWDDRHEFINVYNINKLDLSDRRLIKVLMSSESPYCEDLANVGVHVKLQEGVQRLVSGYRCNYIPYQVLKDRKDGDKFDYIIMLPYRIFIKLHVTCHQDISNEYYYDFTNNEIREKFKTFKEAVDVCKSVKLIP